MLPRVGRVARAVVPAAVEGEEARSLPLEVGAEAHLALVHREVCHATAALEQLLARAAVLPVLPDCVVHRLLREVVLELEGEDGEPVDEEPEVKRPPRLVPAVAKLAGDGEAVRREAFSRLRVFRRRRAVEEVERVRAVLEAVAQHFHDAALRDLALQSGEEAASSRAILGEVQRFGDAGLGRAEEGAELGEIHAVFALVVAGVAAGPADPAVAGGRLGDRVRGDRIAGMAGQGGADQAFEPALGGVGGHVGGVSGNAAAASCTSSLPVTTSAMRRVRNSLMRSIWRATLSAAR